MTLPAMLDVAIALIFVFLVLSLIVTAVNELIAQLFSLRARGLRGGIERLVADDNFTALLETTGIYQLGAASKSKRGPSYLSGRNFALAVIEAAGDPEKVSDRLNDITGTLEALPTKSKFRDALVTVTAAAKDDTEAKLKAIGDYFDEAMERAGGVYKRWMQLCSLAIGIVLAVALNADAIHVARETWRDEALRAQLVAAAQEMMEVYVEATDYPEEMADVEANLSALRPFPIGWDASRISLSGESLAYDWELWLSKIVGLLITGFATMLGAPFWFDLLSKFMKIRASGKTPTEPPKPDGASNASG